MDFGGFLADAFASPEAIFIYIVIICVLLILTVFLLFWYSGCFEDVDVKTCKSPVGELEVAYKYVRGSHKDSSIVYAEAHSLISYARCIGVYYNNSKEDNSVSDNNVQAMVGIILNDKECEVNEEDRQRMVSKGFQITKFPVVEYVVYAEFQNKSFLSVLIAMNKLLPQFLRYIEEMKLEAYPLIEICDGSKIIYMAPLSKQTEFYIYEALADSEEDITSDKTVDEPEDVSSKDLEELPESLNSVDSLMESGSKVEELPSNEDVIDSLEQKDKTPGSSEASTESFEELQLDS